MLNLRVTRSRGHRHVLEVLGAHARGRQYSTIPLSRRHWIVDDVIGDGDVLDARTWSGQARVGVSISLITDRSPYDVGPRRPRAAAHCHCVPNITRASNSWSRGLGPRVRSRASVLLLVVASTAAPKRHATLRTNVHRVARPSRCSRRPGLERSSFHHGHGQQTTAMGSRGPPVARGGSRRGHGQQTTATKGPSTSARTSREYIYIYRRTLIVMSI